jgi:PIN domain nuclease of toxin-antitoxin system
VRYLLDTQLLLWATVDDRRFPEWLRDALSIRDTVPIFSAVSILEVAIKYGLYRPTFDVDPHVLRRVLVEADYVELPVTGAHAAAVADLPAIHRDPFDRLLAAQAQVEGIELLTADATLARYPGPIRRV